MLWMKALTGCLQWIFNSGQCVGYFDIPVDHVYGDSVILDYLASKRISSGDLVCTLVHMILNTKCHIPWQHAKGLAFARQSYLDLEVRLRS